MARFLVPAALVALLAGHARAQITGGSITITGSPLTMTITPCFAAAKQQVAFDCTLGASNGAGNYTFSKVSGSFPAGINDVSSTGEVSGTPTGITAGTEIVKLMDSAGTSLQVSITVTPAALTGSGPCGSAICVTPTNSSVSVSQTLQMRAVSYWSDGTSLDISSQATWSVTGTGGASVSANGLFTASSSAGSPVVKAVFDSVTDDGGSGVTVTVSSTAPAITTPLTLPEGQIGQAYPEAFGNQAAGAGFLVTASGGTPPYSCSLTSGSLQSLTLSSGCLLSGTPSGAGGSSSPVIKVTDSATPTPGTVSATFTLPVATLSTVTVTPASPSIAVNATQQFAAAGNYSDSSVVNNLPPSGGGAIATVGSPVAVASTAAGTSLQTASFNAVAGNFLYVVCRHGTDTTTTCTPTDTAGNTFTSTGTAITNATVGLQQAFYAANITGNLADKVTCTFSASVSYRACEVVQKSGVATSSPTDGHQSVSQTTASNTLTESNGLTTANANDVIFSSCTISNTSQTFTASSPFTADITDSIGTMMLEEQTVSATQTGITPSMTVTGTAVQYTCIADAFKAAGGGGGLVAWSSGTPAVATISASGLATAVNNTSGTTSTIQACVGATCGSTVLTVTNPSDTSLLVSPATASVNVATCLAQGQTNITATNGGLGTPNPAVLSCGPASTSLFSDGFETGDFSQWTNIINNPNTCAVSSPATCNWSIVTSGTGQVHSGTFAARSHYATSISSDDNGEITKNISPQRTLYVRGWFYMQNNGGNLTSGQSIIRKVLWMFWGSNVAGAQGQAVVLTLNGGGTSGLTPVLTDVSCTTSPYVQGFNQTYAFNGWNEFEVGATLNTLGQANGSWNLWVNGVQATPQSGVGTGLTGIQFEKTCSSAAQPAFATVWVGQQLETPSGITLDEYRFFDDIVFSTGFVQ